MAAEFLKKGWYVVGTVRDGTTQTLLHESADQYKDRLEIEHLDITDSDQIAALHDHLSARRFDILFVNAGTANTNQGETIAEVSTAEFVDVMVTNALSPMRVIEVNVLISKQGKPGLEYLNRYCRSPHLRCRKRS